MSHDDPFTLSPLGNTSLSSGLGLGVAAFGDDLAANDICPASALMGPNRLN